jgi:hypothetical protein
VITSITAVAAIITAAILAALHRMNVDLRADRGDAEDRQRRH